MDEGLIAAIAFASFMFAAGFLAGMMGEEKAIQRDLIERGLAIHCPFDGKFAFIGECEQ